MSFAVVLEGMTLAAFLTIIGGGVEKRSKGWKVLCLLLGIVGIVQCTAMALVVSKVDLESFMRGADCLLRRSYSTTMTAFSLDSTSITPSYSVL